MLTKNTQASKPKKKKKNVHMRNKKKIKSKWLKKTAATTRGINKRDIR